MSTGSLREHYLKGAGAGWGAKISYTTCLLTAEDKGGYGGHLGQACVFVARVRHLCRCEESQRFLSQGFVPETPFQMTYITGP